MSLKKISGFTLAETLITLGIIGVVAAITIPIIRQRIFEAQTVAKLKETYSILSQAIKMSEEEYGEIPSWNLKGSMSSADAELIATNLKPFIKLALDCGLDDSAGSCIPNTQYKLLNGQITHNYTSERNYYKINLLNGSSIWWRSNAVYGSTTDLVTFFIDTNGKQKPNQWGRDLFAFSYTEASKLRPYGSPDDNSYGSYTTSCKKTSAGYGCAYYVLTFNKMDYLR